MIRILGKIPQNVCIAVSGGRDSMAVLDFFRRGRKNVVVLHYNHGTEHAKDAQQCVAHYCKEHEIPLCVGQNTDSKPKDQSWEEFWRNKRDQWLNGCFFCIGIYREQNN